VTHPFHPWRDRTFVLIGVRHNWGEDRVFFLDDRAVLKSLPRGWTDQGDPDPFVAMAEGRSPFRCEDLLALAELLDGLTEGGGEHRV
jgi:hypothetical protein